MVLLLCLLSLILFSVCLGLFWSRIRLSVTLAETSTREANLRSQAALDKLVLKCGSFFKDKAPEERLFTQVVQEVGMTCGALSAVCVRCHLENGAPVTDRIGFWAKKDEPMKNMRRSAFWQPFVVYLMSHESLIIDNINDKNVAVGATYELVDTLQAEGVGSVMLLPLRLGGQVYGLLGIMFSEMHAFTQAERDALSGVARLCCLGDQLPSDFHHDFRTSLHAVIGFCELLQDADISPEQLHGYLRALHTACKELLRMPGVEPAGKSDPDKFTPVSPAPRLLIVDDVPMNLQVLGCMLNRLGVPFTACSSGSDALHHLSKNHFDMVLTDLRMPAMDGAELCERIRQSPDKKEMPVCALTAELSVESNLFDRVLHKPLTLDKLRSFLMEADKLNTAG